MSIYQRYRTDHKGRYSQRRRHVSASDVELFEWVRRTGADFPAFFQHVYRWPIPYDNFSSEAHDRFGYVMRFENLTADFGKVLDLLGIPAKRSLPVVNATAEKGKEFASYYPPEIVPRAKWIFGPFMRRWGYAFPAEWGTSPPPASSQVAYQVFGPSETSIDACSTMEPMPSGEVRREPGFSGSGMTPSLRHVARRARRIGHDPWRQHLYCPSS